MFLIVQGIVTCFIWEYSKALGTNDLTVFGNKVEVSLPL